MREASGVTRALELAAPGAAPRAVQWAAVLVEQRCPRRRRSRQQLPGRCTAESHGLEDVLDDGRILDAGDDLDRLAALLAAFDPDFGMVFSSNGKDSTLTVIQQETPDEYQVPDSHTILVAQPK
jgi:hypothetical protein